MAYGQNTKSERVLQIIVEDAAGTFKSNGAPILMANADHEWQDDDNFDNFRQAGINGSDEFNAVTQQSVKCDVDFVPYYNLIDDTLLQFVLPLPGGASDVTAAGKRTRVSKLNQFGRLDRRTFTAEEGVPANARRATYGLIGSWSMNSQRGDNGKCRGKMAMMLRKSADDQTLTGWAAQNEIIRIAANAVTTDKNFTLPATPLGAGGTISVVRGETPATFLSKVKAQCPGYVDAGVVSGGSGIPAAISSPVVDAVVVGALATGATSCSANVTIPTTNNRYLVVAVGDATMVINDVKANGVAMTLLKKQTNAAIYGLLAPASGAMTIIATGTTTGNAQITAYALSNVDQAAALDATAGVSPAGTAISDPITTVTANDLVIDLLWASGPTLNTVTPGAGQTATTPVLLLAGNYYAASSYKVATTAGVNNMVWTLNASNTNFHAIVAIKGAAAVSNGDLTLTLGGATLGNKPQVDPTPVADGSGWSIGVVQQGSDGSGGVSPAPKPILPDHWMFYRASTLAGLGSATAAAKTVDKWEIKADGLVKPKFSQDRDPSYTSHVDGGTDEVQYTFEVTLPTDTADGHCSQMRNGAKAYVSTPQWWRLEALCPDGVHKVVIDFYGSVSGNVPYEYAGNVEERKFTFGLIRNQADGYNFSVTTVVAV